MVIFFMIMRGIRRPLRQRGARSSRSRTRTRCCRPGCTRSCWCPSCTSRRCGRSPTPRRPAPTCSRRSTSRPTPRRPRPAAGGVGRAQHRRAAQGAALAVPRAHPPDRRVRHRDQDGQPARRGRRLHPRVRRRPLVGAAAAQPDRAAAQGPAAVHPGRDGDLGALPAAFLGDRPRARRARPGSRSGRATCAPATSTTAAKTARSRGEPCAPPDPPTAAAEGRSRVGERYDAEVGPVAHGGHCVVRLPEPESRVVFVRHAIPGERVVVEITEGDRRGPVLAGGRRRGAGAPRRTGSRRRARTPDPGAAGAATSSTSRWSGQRELKAAVVREQLARLAGLDVEVVGRAGPGRRGRPALAHPAAVRRPRRRPSGHAQAPLPRGRRRSTTA